MPIIHTNSTDKREFLKSVRTDEWKLIYKLETTYRKQESINKTFFELYDLEDEPGEQRNVLDEHPEVFRELMGGMLDMGVENTPAMTVEVDEGIKKQLRELGYLT